MPQHATSYKENNYLDFLVYNAGKHDFTGGFRSHDLNRWLTFYQNLRLLPQNAITLGADYKNF